MALLAGKTLGEFELLSVIGIGGFSTVYLALNSEGLEVAIKVLAENHAYDADVRERFISEADALRRVRSDLIVEVYDLGETPDGQPYIALQYANRGDLVHRRRELIRNGWKPRADDLKFLIDAIADVLEAVHAKDFIHRDIAPSNILIHSAKRDLNRGSVPFLRSDESLLLADFGLVKDLAEGSGLTVGAGTPGFSAPEQRTGLSLIDQRIDIYAASAVVLWFLTGATVPTMPDWREHLVDQQLPASLVDAIGKSLAAVPEDRHQTIDDWHCDINNNLLLLSDSEVEDKVELLGTGNRSKDDQNSASRLDFVRSAQTRFDLTSAKPKLLAAASLALIAMAGGLLVSNFVSSEQTSTPSTEAGAQSPSSTEILADLVTTSEPSQAEASTSEATDDSIEVSPTTTTTLSQLSDRTVPPPEIGDAYFEFAEGERVVIVEWLPTELPAGVIGREIGIAVNEGPFVSNSPIVEDIEDPIKIKPVSDENVYRIRARWLVSGEAPSGWSPTRTVEADE